MISKVHYMVCVGLLLLHRKSWTKAEFFTAIAQMEPLLELHKRIIGVLDKYITKEEKRISILNGRLQLYKIEHKKAMEDIPNYLGNPINAFILIKRLTTDLDAIDDSIRIGIEYINNTTIRFDDVKYPTMEDLTGAAQALTRLQATYRLDVHDLAEGVLNGAQHSHSMTAADCFELARVVYNVRDFNNTIAWSIEALQKIKKEKNISHTLTESDILEYVIFSHFFMGDVKSALEWTKKLLQLNSQHPRARDNISHFEKTIKEREKRKEKKQIEVKSEKNKADLINDMKTYTEDYYRALCRGEVEVPSEITKRLGCHYLIEHHPFLRLAPIKVEQVYINPDVFVFHQVISYDEIDFIVNISLSRLRRDEVQDSKTGEREKVLYRVSQSAWLHDLESDVIARISQRVADMTGLSMQSAEGLQVANYGIGGHFEPHYDFGQEYQNMFTVSEGNRIATVMFYMSEVAQGGATVFTELGLSVFPIKHAALFWMNLHPSGEGDLAMFHAGCPVLRGSKWVGNKWLHQVGQELLKPCNLDYQEEGTRNVLQGIPKTPKYKLINDRIDN